MPRVLPNPPIQLDCLLSHPYSASIEDPSHGGEVIFHQKGKEEGKGGAEGLWEKERGEGLREKERREVCGKRRDGRFVGKGDGGRFVGKGETGGLWDRRRNISSALPFRTESTVKGLWKAETR